MSDIVSRIRNAISPEFDSRTHSEDLAWEAAEVIAAKDAEIERLQQLAGRIAAQAVADVEAKDAEIARLTEDRWDNYQKWLNIIGQPLTPTQPEVPALIDHALRAYSELREQAIRAVMWLNDDGSPCDGPRFREEQSKLRAMLGPDRWWTGFDEPVADRPADVGESS